MEARRNGVEGLYSVPLDLSLVIIETDVSNFRELDYFTRRPCKLPLMLSFTDMLLSLEEMP